jgi:hypothetical protein
MVQHCSEEQCIPPQACQAGPFTFIAQYEFATRILAHMLDNNMQQTRRGLLFALTPLL